MMKRFLCILTLLAAVSCGCSQQGPEPSGGQSAERPWRLTVDGKPFLMLGAQLRTDFFRDLDHKKLDQLDKYFSLAASLNITVVQIAFSWSDVEKDYDIYSDEAVRAYIGYCEKYGLKAELLWFGSFMCGYTVEKHLPSYVMADAEKYPRFDPIWDGWQGKQFFLKPGTSALLERESKAIGKLMEFIDRIDSESGRPHTVIGIQVENEPDMLASRHFGMVGQSTANLWPGILHHLDVIGKAVKQSSYDCYTRVNITLDEDFQKWGAMVFKREGIDYLGLDPYTADVARIGELMAYLQSLPGNFAHVAENGGEFYNNDVLTLKALSMGCGYEVFEVVTTPDPQLKDWTLRGVYNPDFTPKGQTQRLINAYGIFKGAWYDLATADTKYIHAFNITKSEGQEKATETVALRSGNLTWTTTSRGIAFAVEGPDYLTVASTKADRLDFNTVPRSAEKGHYDQQGNWVREADALAGSSFTMEACKVYRIKL